MGDADFTWRDYEDHIYEKLSEWAAPDAEVTFDQKVRGKFSGIDRQVDVVVKGRFANVTGKEMTAAVDCKYYTREIDVKKVDEFIGYIEDVQADIGILVTNKGFTPAARRRASRGIDLRVIVAEIDRLPPSYFSSWDEGYYESDYYEGGPGARSQDGATISYFYIDPVGLEYTFDPDRPPEQLDEPVLAGPGQEVSWGDNEARAKCVAAILRHRGGGEEPDPEDVKRVVLELAYWWEDGQTWALFDGQLTDLGV